MLKLLLGAAVLWLVWYVWRSFRVAARLVREVAADQAAGADGVRNIRANATAGFDRREFLDVSPLAREAQYRILSDRKLQALHLSCHSDHFVQRRRNET